ncbi:MAG: MFS transporter [Candidatus Eremiobacteraeota bacterium]|nr:MFS transporter [Candidatus Eremiobacteraeota bacterium]MCW5866159.1 MFS transporter [Candidatus Eremiobacteraeota bacterium]
MSISWRSKVFLSTALTYAGYYFGRKTFYVCKASLGQSLQLDAAGLGWLGTAFLATYALGQFGAGGAGTRWGARRLVLVGMALSILCNLGMGWAASWPILAFWLLLNGLAQASGWPGTVATMAQWFGRAERGTVMGFWSTGYQLGAGLATTLASYMLGRAGYPAAFAAGAGVLGLAMIVFFFWQRNSPRDVGLPAVDQEESTGENGGAEPWTRKAAGAVALLGCFYFFAKFIRYALWSWVPFLLHDSYGLSEADSGYFSTIYDWASLAGAIVAGLISDHMRRGGRIFVCFLFTILVVLSCLAMVSYGGNSLPIFGICLGSVGFFLSGPDTLVSGAVAIEAAPRGHAATGAGVVNGMGSVGAVLQEVVLGSILRDAGVKGFVLTLTLSSVLALVSLGVMLTPWARRR